MNRLCVALGGSPRIMRGKPHFIVAGMTAPREARIALPHPREPLAPSLQNVSAKARL